MSLLTMVAVSHGSVPPATAAFFQRRYEPLRKAVVRASVAYRDLQNGSVVLSTNERAGVLRTVVQQIHRFELSANLIWPQFPEGVTANYWTLMLNRVDELHTLATQSLVQIEDRLRRMTAAKASVHSGQRSAKRNFETADQESLIGTPRRTTGGEEVIDIEDPVSGGALETYHKDINGLCVPGARTDIAPLPIGASLAEAIREARAQLTHSATVVRRVEEHGRLNMEPLSLDEALSNHASELRDRAAEIHRLGSQDDGLLTQLEDQVLLLIREGGRLRALHIKRMAPTPALLEYLLRSGEARIQKVGERIPMRNAQGRIADHPQEYAVLDTRNDRPLWYAHFSLRSSRCAFRGVHPSAYENGRAASTWASMANASGATWRGDHAAAPGADLCAVRGRALQERRVAVSSGRRPAERAFPYSLTGSLLAGTIFLRRYPLAQLDHLFAHPAVRGILIGAFVPVQVCFHGGQVVDRHCYVIQVVALGKALRHGHHHVGLLQYLGRHQVVLRAQGNPALQAEFAKGEIDLSKAVAAA